LIWFRKNIRTNEHTHSHTRAFIHIRSCDYLAVETELLCCKHGAFLITHKKLVWHHKDTHQKTCTHTHTRACARNTHTHTRTHIHTKDSFTHPEFILRVAPPHHPPFPVFFSRTFRSSSTPISGVFFIFFFRSSNLPVCIFRSLFPKMCRSSKKGLF